MAIAPTVANAACSGLDALGNRHAEVDRHPVDLGVEGELVAGGGDEVTDRELLRAGADLDDDAAQ